MSANARMYCRTLWCMLWLAGAVSACSGAPDRMPSTSPGSGNSHHLSEVRWPAPVQPNPSAPSLKPGLSVRYFKKKIRHVSDMPDSQAMLQKGYPGKPVLQLAHQFGKGEVFDSGESRGICVQMSGLLHFAEMGEYFLKANANDGIRIFVDGEKIIDDPGVHGDRVTESNGIPIRDPGWIPIHIRYFQRKGTATLELYWQEPGTDLFVIIPAKAYGHTD